MSNPMDKILAEYTDQAFEITRLRRNGVHTRCDRVSAEMLAELEAGRRCDAVRGNPRSNCLESNAKPSQYLKDLQLDAEADLEDF